ncbi:MAG: peptidylprolyl isomerase [Burkholderiaceae bacterium]
MDELYGDDAAGEELSRIRDGWWVTVHYRLWDAQGEPLEDQTRELTYLHGGYGAILPRLEEALDGRAAGESVSVRLEPDDAFGDYDPELLVIVPRDRLPGEVETGMVFENVPGQAADGLLYTVTDLAQGQAVLDGNHPLAGIAVRFDIVVQDMRPATDDEVAAERLAALDGGASSAGGPLH